MSLTKTLSRVKKMVQGVGRQCSEGKPEGSRQGLKGRRRVERWAHQESRISLIPGRALAGEWHHREVLP